jgi:hypothetical protein
MCNLLRIFLYGGDSDIFLGDDLPSCEEFYSRGQIYRAPKEVSLCASIYFQRDHDFWLL